VDLLVVTHCHDDHIGQLPELVADGTLTTKVVLTADEKFGWGLANDGADSFAGLEARQRGLITALLEEDRSDLPKDELEAFVQDAAKLIDRYREMLTALDAAGARVVRYGRDPDARVREIERDFRDFGLRILGPTQEHLLVCADAIASV
jgi:glyoxylase-like metal-dependent hydrolase (beta-lactamase superfamily II)